MSSERKLNLKIVCLTGIKYDGHVHSAIVCVQDGLMQVNKNYGSVIEELKGGKIKIYEDDTKTNPIFFQISNGWLVNKKNICNIYVSEANKL